MATAVSPADALARAMQWLPAEPARAEAQARAILAVLPDDARALFVVGAARRRLGDAAGARAVLERVVAANTASAFAHYELGLALAALGESAASLAVLQRSDTLRRDLPQAWLALGDQLALAGDRDGAAAARTEHLAGAATLPDLRAAAEMLRAGRLNDAVPLLVRHLRHAPKDLAVTKILAETLLRLDRKDDCELLLARCIALAPDDREARFAYATVLYHQAKPAAALEQLEILLEAAPQDLKLRFLHTLCLVLHGDYAGGAEAAAALEQEYPAEPGIVLCRGQALRILGQSGDAIAAFRRALTLRPAMGEAWWCLADMKTVRLTDADVQDMQRHAANPALSVETRVHLHYALGKAHEDRAAWAESFGHYAKGAALHRARIAYDADHTTAEIAASMAAVTDAKLPDAPDAAALVPVFVVGLPRSGSTLVEQILASHPDVEAAAELPYLPHIANTLRRSARTGRAASFAGAVAGLDAAERRALGAHYLAQAARHLTGGRRVFVDKMPANFVNIALIRQILPQARIADVRRHPMAACFSNFKQLFLHGQEFTYALNDVGRYYRDYWRLMRHVELVLPGYVHTLIYEDLACDTETEVRRLLAHCGLPFHPACLRHWDSTRPVSTHSSEQVRRPVFRDGLTQWRHYEPWLTPLVEPLGDALAGWRANRPAFPAF